MAKDSFTYTNSKGTVYHLNKMDRTMSGGRVQSLFYFSKAPTEHSISEIPDNKVVHEAPNGFPILKNKV